MERAGHAVALAAARWGAGYGKRVLVLAGPGNNGGDGYVAARILRERGAQVVVHALGPPRTPEASAAAASAGVPVVQLGEPSDCDLIVDALFGGGVRGGISEPMRAWMELDVPVVSVDYPTGLDPHTGQVLEHAFTAQETVTFSTLKTGHVRGDGPARCGVVTVVDIGINGGEPSFFIAEAEDAHRPHRRTDDHKWSAGSVLVVGGSPGMVGAAVFAGKAALRFGAGAVVLSTPVGPSVQQLAPELVVRTAENVLEDLERIDVVLAGPGLDAGDVGPYEPILRKAKRVVLDAGGLDPDLLGMAIEGDAEVVVTPHDAEFARVAGVGAGTYSIRAFASRHGIVVLRKGNPTMITDGCPPVFVDSGGPELATMGTGDVLAGMISALMARGLEGVDAAISGAYWHGVAGAQLQRRQSVTADRLVEEVGRFAW